MRFQDLGIYKCSEFAKIVCSRFRSALTIIGENGTMFTVRERNTLAARRNIFKSTNASAKYLFFGGKNGN